MTKHASPPPVEPGDQVQTPSGMVAEVIVVYPDVGEALVQWSSGDRARFRFTLLRPFAKPSQ
jgi:hypothetical protein